MGDFHTVNTGGWSCLASLDVVLCSPWASCYDAFWDQIALVYPGMTELGVGYWENAGDLLDGAHAGGRDKTCEDSSDCGMGLDCVMDSSSDGVDWPYDSALGMEGDWKSHGEDLICVSDCDYEDDWEGWVNEGDSSLGQAEAGKLVYPFPNKEVFGLDTAVVVGIPRSEVLEVHWRNLNTCYAAEEGHFGVQLDLQLVCL